MDIIIETEQLKEKLEIASQFVARGRTDIEITKCVLITARDGDLFFDASNFYEGCKLRLREGTEIKEEGQIVVETFKFQKLIKTMEGDKVSLTTKRGSLKLRDLHRESLNTFSLALIDGPDKFPTIPFPDDPKDYRMVNRELFLSLIKKVSFAAEDPKLMSEQTNNYSKMIHFEGVLVYATNTQKIAAVIEPKLEIPGLHLPKNAVKYFRDLSEEFKLYLEENMFHVQDGDLFFMVRNEIINPPTSKVRKFLDKPKKIAVSYEPDEDTLKEIINALKQFRILNESVILYITDSTLWLGGIDYTDDIGNNFDNSIKAISISPTNFNEEVMVTFKIKNLLQLLRSVNKPEIVFRGSYTEQDAFIRVFEGNYQAIVQRLVSNYETEFVRKIKEDYIGT